MKNLVTDSQFITRHLYFILLGILSLWLTACAVTDAPPTVSPTTTLSAPASVEGLTSPRLIYLDPEQSSIEIYVYRGGRLASLGHNHVISVRDIHGVIYLSPEPSQSSFSLAFATADLVVDDPALRAAAGSAFNSTPTIAEIKGTRRNMLGPKVLNAEQYPLISVRSLSLKPQQALSTGDYIAELAIAAIGNTHTTSATTRITLAGGQVVATGELKLKQGDLGITPLSLLNGAIAVKDELIIRYRILAPLQIAEAPL